MKKFLTVLLVIAVMFTFSFSSAFAVTNTSYEYDDASKLVNDTANDLTTASESLMNSQLNNYADVTVEVPVAFSDISANAVYLSAATGQINTTMETAGGNYSANGWYIVDADGSLDAGRTYTAAYHTTSETVPNPSNTYPIRSGAYTTVTITKDAAKEVFEELYDAYYTAVTKEARVQGADLYNFYKVDSGVEFLDAPATSHWNYTPSSPARKTASNVLSTARLEAIDKPAYSAIELQANLGKALVAQFKADKADQLLALSKIDTTKYSTSVATDGKSYQTIAGVLVTRATTQIDGFDVTAGTPDLTVANYIKHIADIYTAPVGTTDATGALMTGGTVNGVSYVYDGTTDFNGLNALTKTSDEMTEEAKINYIKPFALNNVKSAIEAQRALEIKAQNDIIFAENLKTKPVQKTIDDAKEAIENINAKYDALTEIWTYRIENGSVAVTVDNNYNSTNQTNHKAAEVFTLYYDKDADGKMAASGEKLAVLGAYGETQIGTGPYTYKKEFYAVKAGTTPLDTVANMVTELDVPTVTGAVAAPVSADLDTAEEIADYIDELEAKAVAIKSAIAVDGDTALDVDDALADAIEEVYMTQVKATINYDSLNYEVHSRVHALLGDTCANHGTLVKDEVKVADKKYDTVLSWTTANAYDDTKLAEVKAIVKDAKAALKAAKTVADADAAFLAAYEKYDAVMTDAEHTALFLYGGALYDAYPKACKEIKAYIGYKADLMGSTFPGSTAALEAYFNDEFKADVYSAEDLATKLAEAKATVEALKTKAELKAEEAALYKEVAAVTAPIDLAKKDTVVELYRKNVDLQDYCTMVGFAGHSISSKYKSTCYALIDGYLQTIIALEQTAMEDLEKVIDKGGVTLEDRANVEALAAAQKAYNDLYYYDLEVIDALEIDANPYVHKIFTLDVEAAEALIAALPMDATAAQVTAAREAIDALGFEAICHASKTTLTKLNKFEQDTIGNEENAKAYVQDLSIKARSTKTSKGVKVTIKADVQPLLDAGFTVEYKFYRSTKSNKNFGKAMITKTTGTYTNTKGVKGTKYYYKAKLVVKNAAGEVVATTPLTQCLYATRTF